MSPPLGELLSFPLSSPAYPGILVDRSLEGFSLTSLVLYVLKDERTVLLSVVVVTNSLFPRHDTKRGKREEGHTEESKSLLSCSIDSLSASIFSQSSRSL